MKKRVQSAQTQNSQEKKIIVRKSSKQKALFFKKDKTPKLEVQSKQKKQSQNFQNIKFVNNKTLLKSQTALSDGKQDNDDDFVDLTEKIKLLETLLPQNKQFKFKKSKTQYFFDNGNTELFLLTKDKVFQYRNQQIQYMKQKIHDQNMKSLHQMGLPQKNEVCSQFKKKYQMNCLDKTLDEKQISKRDQEKAHKKICVQCRYHLQKENTWKKCKIQLQNKIIALQSQIKQIRLKQASILLNPERESSQNQEESTNNSKKSHNNLRHKFSEYENQNEMISSLKEVLLKKQTQIQNLNYQIQQKSKQIEVLAEQLLISELTINKIKQKIEQLNQNEKYLKIQNRTLMKTKTQIMKYQLQNIKLTQERDSFKKKLIQTTKLNSQLQKQIKKYSNNLEQNQNKSSLHQSLISLTSKSQSLQQSLIQFS